MRVNMDSSIVIDARFKLVAQTLGVNWKEVVGSCFLLWLACYERRSTCLRKKEADLVSELSGFSEALISEKLADDMGDGMVHIHGVEERIKFLIKQAESGSKGGKSKGKSKPKQTPKKKQASAQAPAYQSAQANTLTLSPTLSPDLDPISESKNASPKSKPKPKPNPDHQVFIDGFHELFMAHRSGSKPSWRPKELGLVKTLLRAHGLTVCLERAKNMFEAPPSFPPPPFDLSTLSVHFDKFAEPYRDKTGRSEPLGIDDYPDPDEEIAW